MSGEPESGHLTFEVTRDGPKQISGTPIPSAEFVRHQRESEHLDPLGVLTDDEHEAITAELLEQHRIAHPEWSDRG